MHQGLAYVSGTGAGNDTATDEASVQQMSAYDEATGALDNVEKCLQAAA